MKINILIIRMQVVAGGVERSPTNGSNVPHTTTFGENCVNRKPHKGVKYLVFIVTICDVLNQELFLWWFNNLFAFLFTPLRNDDCGYK